MYIYLMFDAASDSQNRVLYCDAACGQIPESVYKKQAVTNIICWLIDVMPLVKVKCRNE